MNRLIPVVLASLLSAPGLSYAQSQFECPQHFENGVPPATLYAAPNTLRPLCLQSGAGAVMYSLARRTPVWAAEHITRSSLTAARRVRRSDAFHEEPALPADARAHPEEYKHSCFDRGHMIPSGDAESADAQFGTFSMANISPQDPANNEGIWESIETATRELAQARGELYVVTGPLYLSSSTELLDNRIAVPTHFYKAVLDPATGEAAVYLSANSPAQTYDIKPLSFLVNISGVNPFPASPAQGKILDLPTPRAGHFHPRPIPAACARTPAGTLQPGQSAFQADDRNAGKMGHTLTTVARHALRAFR